jgi:hypothetical protein
VRSRARKNATHWLRTSLPGAGKDANMQLANVLTTFLFCVQLTKVRLAFGVAVTVTGLPSNN